MVDAAFLVDHGVTNLIEVDGLLYAPVSDLWNFFVNFWFVRLTVLALILFLVFVCVSIVEIVVYFVIWLRKRKKNSDG